MTKPILLIKYHIPCVCFSIAQYWTEVAITGTKSVKIRTSATNVKYINSTLSYGCDCITKVYLMFGGGGIMEQDKQAVTLLDCIRRHPGNRFH